MKKHTTKSGKLSGYDHDNLQSYDATNSSNGILYENYWWLCLKGDATKALTKGTNVFCNIHKSVITDLAENVFAASLDTQEVFLEKGYKRI
jgi:hypothetical protein